MSPAPKNIYFITLSLCVCVCRFVLAAVSPAVVVPSMLLLQRERYGVEKVSRRKALFSLNLLNMQEDRLMMFVMSLCR